MAYQINGNVVIDDNGQGFFENFPLVLTPTNVEPVEGEPFGSPTNIVLKATPFSGVYETHYASQWQIANASSFASGNIVYDSGNSIPGANTITTDATLEFNQEHYFRVRYISNNNVFSEFSEPTCFTASIAPPDGLGCPYQGGYFTGNINIGGGVCYYLVVSAAASGASETQWKTALTSTGGSNSDTDGYTNTYGRLDNVDHPAGNFTATRSINGYTDWYLPATCELCLMRANYNCLPPGEYVTQDNSNGLYWSSREVGGPQAFVWHFGLSYNCQNIDNKTNAHQVRAIRRVPKG